MERFCLQQCISLEIESLPATSAHLGHVLENLLSTPAIDIPVVIVFWSATDAQRAIAATGPAEKPNEFR